MRVIVTGSEGLIGKEVVKYLKKEKYEVHNWDKALGPMFDMTNEYSVAALFNTHKADALVNCFAYNPQ
jgi:dTDP-4-dehydrorhamnose reductase